MFTLLASHANRRSFMPNIDEILESAASLGDAVRRVREARQMTLRELATKIGVSAPFLSDVEHNRRRTDKLGELAAVLEVDLERLRRLDPRLPDDLKQWMDANPEIVSFLESLRQSGR